MENPIKIHDLGENHLILGNTHFISLLARLGMVMLAEVVQKISGILTWSNMGSFDCKSPTKQNKIFKTLTVSLYQQKHRYIHLYITIYIDIYIQNLPHFIRHDLIDITKRLVNPVPTGHYVDLDVNQPSGVQLLRFDIFNTDHSGRIPYTELLNRHHSGFFGLVDD